MNINVTCNCHPNEVVEKVQNLLIQMKLKYGNEIKDLQESWIENKGKFSFTSKGFRITGHIVITNSHIDLNLKLPLAALIFKSKIKSTILDELKKIK